MILLSKKYFINLRCMLKPMLLIFLSTLRLHGTSKSFKDKRMGYKAAVKPTMTRALGKSGSYLERWSTVRCRARGSPASKRRTTRASIALSRRTKKKELSTVSSPLSPWEVGTVRWKDFINSNQSFVVGSEQRNLILARRLASPVSLLKTNKKWNKFIRNRISLMHLDEIPRLCPSFVSENWISQLLQLMANQTTNYLQLMQI